MTAYANFVSDFPQRCLELLDSGKHAAKGRGREITLLLMAASTSLIVPFERLKLDTQYSSHPIGDSKRFPAAANKLDQLRQSQFVGSCLCQATATTWRFSRKIKSIQDGPDAWLADAELMPVTAEKTVGALLTLLRNALAHGNIFTRGNPITELVFLQERTEGEGQSKRRVGFDVLTAEPGDFERLVRAWIIFLQNTEISELLLAA